MLLVMRVLSLVPLNFKVRIQLLVALRPHAIHSLKYDSLTFWRRFVCIAATLAGAAVARAPRFQLLRPVAYASPSDLAGGHLSQHVDEERS